MGVELAKRVREAQDKLFSTPALQLLSTSVCAACGGWVWVQWQQGADAKRKIAQARKQARLQGKKKRKTRPPHARHAASRLSRHVVDA